MSKKKTPQEKRAQAKRERRKTKKASTKAAAKKKAAKAVEDLPELPDRRVMEGAMFGMFGGRAGTPVDQAQDIMYQAWDTADPKRRVALACKALQISEDCADAYVLLAEETTISLAETVKLYGKGVEAGERAIGKKMFEQEVGYFWGVLETRPYMRARCGLAQCLWEVGQHEEAVGHYRDMLRLNPNDNQGIRYLLASCLLELGRDEELAELLQQYPDEWSASWAYSRTLLAFRSNGDTAESRRLLTEALKTNPHVPAFLLGRKKMPKRQPEYIGIGDEREAVYYTGEFGSGWKKTPGALEWLAAQER